MTNRALKKILEEMIASKEIDQETVLLLQDASIHMAGALEISPQVLSLAYTFMAEGHALAWAFGVRSEQLEILGGIGGQEHPEMSGGSPTEEEKAALSRLLKGLDINL